MDTNDVDNLKKFGTTFQVKCIASLLSDRAFIERIVDILSPEFFDTDGNKWVIEKTMEYFLKYKELPTFDFFKIEIQNIPDEVLRAAAFDAVKTSYKHVSDTDIKWVKEQFLGFCRNQKFKFAVFDAVDLVKTGDYEKIKHKFDEALRAGAERNLGHEYLVDVDRRMTLMARDTVKTGWNLIDTLMDGGLGKGELAFVVAPAGSGKSWILAALGANAMKDGKNVMHFTLELNENYVGLRYDAIFTGIAFQEVRNHIPTVKDALTKIPGKLFVKYFPLKTVSAASLKMHIDRLQLITGVKIDLVIVDYADILRPFMQERNSNSYNEVGSVYEELRQMAGELQVPVWSASQSNRGAHEEEVIQAHNVADSYRKIMTGDFILSLSRKMEDKMAGTGRFHIIKNRFGADGMTFLCSVDTSCGNIKVYDKNSAEGAEILQKSKDAAGSVKDLLKKRWKETHGDGDDDGTM
jgi:hypothetical protein